MSPSLAIWSWKVLLKLDLKFLFCFSHIRLNHVKCQIKKPSCLLAIHTNTYSLSKIFSRVLKILLWVPSLLFWVWTPKNLILTLVESCCFNVSTNPLLWFYSCPTLQLPSSLPPDRKTIDTCWPNEGSRVIFHNDPGYYSNPFCMQQQLFNITSQVSFTRILNKWM